MSSPGEPFEAISGLVPPEAVFDRSEDYGRTQIYFFNAGDAHEPDLVAKHDCTWSEGEARSVFEAHNRISHALASSDRMGAPRALAWSADPPVVIMELAAGDAVSGLARGAVGATSDIPIAMDAARLSGRALALLHATLPAPIEGNRDVIGYAQRMFREKPSRLTCSELPRVCRMNDYATYNQFYDSDHGLSLLDPPAVAQASVPHDDVGYFLASLMHSVVGSNGLRHRRSALRLYAGLAEAFLKEYSAAGSYDLGGPRDRELVGLVASYHSANWGWRRRKSRGLRKASLDALYWAAKSRFVPGARPWLK